MPCPSRFRATLIASATISAVASAALPLAVASARPLPLGASDAGDMAAPPPQVLGGPGHALVYPSGMEVAPTGDVVVADTGNDSVAKFTSAGQLIWRVSAGSGPGQDAENARDIAIDDDGFIYVADAAEVKIIKLTPNGQVVGAPWGGPAGDRLGSPIGITAKNGKVYVSDGAKRKVRIFNPSGTQVGHVVSDGPCVMAPVRDADADAAGNVYVANYTDSTILKFGPDGSCLDVWGSKGVGPGQFKNPYGVRVAQDPVWGETVYVADSNNNRIQMLSPRGDFLAQVGRTGTSTQTGTFTTLRRVAVAANGDVWGADLWGWRLVRFKRTASGYAYGSTVGGTAPPLLAGKVFNEPRAVAVGPDGNLNVVDTVNQRIVTMSSAGAVLRACGERDSRPVSVNWPRGVAVDPVTGDRWLADTKQSRLQIFPQNCSEKTRVGYIGAGPGQFNWPHAIAIRAGDRLAFVADTKNNRVSVWDVATRKVVTAYAGAGLLEPRGISVVEGTNQVLVADTGHDAVVILTYTRAAGFKVVKRILPGLLDPEGVAVDVNARVWIADTGHNRVVVTTQAGAVVETIATAAGRGLAAPSAIGVAGRTVYVSDTDNDRVLAYGL